MAFWKTFTRAKNITAHMFGSYFFVPLEVGCYRKYLNTHFGMPATHKFAHSNNENTDSV